MAFTATTVWEVESTGSDTNGGGFDPALTGTDYTYGGGQTVITYTDMVIGVTTTQVTSVNRAFIAADVGNVINVTSGTGFTVQRVQIVSVAGGTATGDKSFGTTASTGGNGRLGGALATPGLASGLMVGGNTAHVKAATYTVTSASTNIASGCVALIAGVSANVQTRMIGYSSTRGDTPIKGSRPLLQASGISTFTLVNMAAGSHVECLSADGASLTSSRGIACGTSGAQAYLCDVANCTNNGMTGTPGAPVLDCYATGCSTNPAFSGGTWTRCVADGNSVTGFNLTSVGSFAFDCVACNNTGASSDGFSYNTNGMVATNCTAYNNGRHGFFAAVVVTAHQMLDNCVAEGNGQSSGTGYGFSTNAAAQCVYLINCAAQGAGASAYNNKTGDYNSSNIVRVVGQITPTASVFTNAGGKDFSLNNNGGGGLLLRAAAIPTATGSWVLQGLSTPTYKDVGAVQHADPTFAYDIME